MATMLLAQEALSNRDQFQRKALAGALLGPVQLSATEWCSGFNSG